MVHVGFVVVVVVCGPPARACINQIQNTPIKFFLQFFTEFGMIELMIVSFINFKGGTGRTSSVFATGEILSGAYGKKVLMVDLDFQRSLSYLSGIKADKTIVDVLSGDSLNEAIYQVRENLFILPSDSRLAEIDNPKSLQGILERAAGVSDYVLLDYPPSLNPVTAAGLISSNYIVICTRPTALDIAGLDLLMESIDQAKALNPALKVAGVLLTFVDRRSISMRKVIENIDLKILGSIGVSVKVAEAVGKSIVRYSPSNPRSSEYMEFVSNLLEIIK